MAHFCGCGKKLSSYHSLWRHKKICKKNQLPRPISINQQDNNEKIVGDILNKVVQRVDMDVKPMTQKNPNQPLKKLHLPVEVVNNIKPKPLIDIAIGMEKKSTPNPMDISDEESESDSDVDISDSNEEETDPDTEFMPDNPEDFKKEFKHLFNKLNNNVEIYILNLYSCWTK